MIKCDICNKTMILPEKLGESNICKKCLFKINGHIWKYMNIEHNKDLEHYRNKAIETSQKLNYPQKVIDEINNYFEQKMSNMIMCEACGEKTLKTHNMGGANICKKCYSNIETKEWKNINYMSKEELEEDRKNILKIASDLKFPQLALDEINKHFDSKAEKNWLYTIDGKKGQVIKIYENHFVIVTKSDFDMSTIEEEYNEINIKDNPTIHKIKKEDVKNLTTGIIGNGGDIVKDLLIAGITKGKLTEKKLGKMTDKFSNSFESTIENYIDVAYDNYYAEKKSFTSLGEEHYFSYSDFDIISFRNIGNDNLGYLKFQNKITINNNEYDVLFFYGRDIKSKVKKIMPSVYSLLFKKINESKVRLPNKEDEEKIQVDTQVNDLKVLDDIVKFKELLDSGIITQEEFDKKKKELLRL